MTNDEKIRLQIEKDKALFCIIIGVFFIIMGIIEMIMFIGIVGIWC